MARHADGNWNLPEKAETWQQVEVALLMDIRSELRKINVSLGCHRIQRMFGTIERMDRRLAPKKPLRRGRR